MTLVFLTLISRPQNPLALEREKKRSVMTTGNEHEIHRKPLHYCTTPYWLTFGTFPSFPQDAVAPGTPLHVRLFAWSLGTELELYYVPSDLPCKVEIGAALVSGFCRLGSLPFRESVWTAVDRLEQRIGPAGPRRPSLCVYGRLLDWAFFPQDPGANGECLKLLGSGNKNVQTFWFSE